MIVRASLVALLAATAAHAIELDVPGGRMTASEGPIADSLVLPSRPYAPGRAPEVRTGMTERQAWRIPGRSDTPVQITAPLAQQLIDQGYRIVFACSDRDCGGFDFRFELSLLPAPAMHVDLGDFRYVLAQKGEGDAARFVSLVASRAGQSGTLHVTEVAPQGAAPAPVPVPQVAPTPPAKVQAPAAPSDIVARLEAEGHVVLDAIDFPSGAASLPDGDYPGIAALARWLRTMPEARIVFVGHTDAVGSLQANTELSRQRAAAVAARVAELAPEAQGRITSAGAGYLSPRASNLDETGRAANRRVEAVLLSR